MSESKHPEIDPDQSCFLRLPVKCLATVLAALRAAGFEPQAREVESFTRNYTDPKLNALRLEWVERADAVARDGEIEFDSDATIGDSEGGQYVLGWVWVDEEDGKDEEDDEDDEDDEDEVERVVADNAAWTTPQLEDELQDKLRQLAAQGGRGVELADRVDEIRTVLSARGRKAL